MIDKSALRTTIENVLTEHDIADRDVTDDLVEALQRDFAEEIHDDDEAVDEDE